MSRFAEKQARHKIAAQLVRQYKSAFLTGIAIEFHGESDTPIEDANVAIKLLRKQGYRVKLLQIACEDDSGNQVVNLGFQQVVAKGRNRAKQVRGCRKHRAHSQQKMLEKSSRRDSPTSTLLPADVPGSA